MTSNCRLYNATRKYAKRSDNTFWCTTCRKFVRKPHKKLHVEILRAELMLEYQVRQERLFTRFWREISREYQTSN